MWLALHYAHRRDRRTARLHFRSRTGLSLWSVVRLHPKEVITGCEKHEPRTSRYSAAERDSLLSSLQVAHGRLVAAPGLVGQRRSGEATCLGAD